MRIFGFATLASVLLISANVALSATVFNFAFDSASSPSISTSYRDYDGANPSDTQWYLNGYFVVDSADEVVESSEVVDWGLSFSDGTDSFSYFAGDPNQFVFRLDGILVGDDLLIHKLNAQVRENTNIGEMREIVEYEFRDSELEMFYRLTVDGYTRLSDRSDTDGFRGRASIDDKLTATMAPVPLPAAAWLLLAGLGGLAVVRRTARYAEIKPSPKPRSLLKARGAFFPLKFLHIPYALVRS